MPVPHILVLAGSIRAGSYNARLAACAARVLINADARVTRLSLADYPLPLYHGDLESRAGPPENARHLAGFFASSHGVFITSPEYNASLTPLLKNTIDWISRVRAQDAPPLFAFKGRAFAIGSASNGTYGGMRSLMALRHVLELGCGALVIPEQIAVRQASQAFDEGDALRDPASAQLLERVLQRLTAVAQQLTPRAPEAPSSSAGPA